MNVRRCISLLVLAAAFSLVCPAGRAEDAWHLPGWTFRKVLDVPQAAPGAWVDTFLGPYAAADGSDIRVVSRDGRPMNVKIVHRTPEGRFLVLFEAAAGRGIYFLYSGRPGAASAPAWNPRIGLLLEVRTRADGDCDTWQQMSRMIQASKDVQGIGFRRMIFDGFNPFGPSDDYISLYRGWLNCAKPGTYEFSTISDEASFLFVEGRPVCQWPGRHPAPPGRNSRFSGRVDLTAGVHEIEYCHVEYDGDQTAGAAWRPPGEPGFRIIPASAFVEAAPATVLQSERRGAPVTVDFDLEPVAYLELDGARLVAVRFRFTGSSSNEQLRIIQWEFGDGAVGSGPAPTHLYGAVGVFTVKVTALAASRRRAALDAKIRVAPKWDDLDFRLPKIEHFAKLASDYPFNQMTAAPLAGLLHLFKVAGQDPPLLKVCQALYPQRDQLAPAVRYDLLVTMGDLSRQTPDEALRLYQSALELAGSDKTRAFAVEMKMADALFYYKRDLKDAFELYAQLRERYPRTDPVLHRIALIRMGDVLRAQADEPKARAIYEEAEENAPLKPDQPRHVLFGAYAASVTGLLARNEAALALEELDKWEWLFPTARLSGYNLTLRARANLILGDFPEARKQAETFLGFGTDPNVVPEALLLAAEACKSLADTKAARQYLTRLVDQYPESPLHERARGLLRLLPQ